MYIKPAILLDYLRSRWEVTQIGKKPSEAELPLPIFYSRGQGTSPNQLYVARTSDLPQNCNHKCIFVCIGKRPVSISYSWGSTIYYIEDGEPDVLSVFNFIQDYFNRVNHWAFQMQILLAKNAQIPEFVQASMAFFDNGIIITDYSLQILVNCQATTENGTVKIAMDWERERIPNNISAGFAQEFLERTSARTPYFFKGQEKNPEGNNYCINLYLGDTYVGCCTMYDCIHPMRECDLLLFQVFASFIKKAFQKNAALPGGQIVTIKSIFSSLLQSFPVSTEDRNMAIQLLQHNMDLSRKQFGCWHCIVIRSANRNKVLPEQYICQTIEEMLPHTTAVFYEDAIVLLCAIPDNDTAEDTVCNILLPYLKDMNFHAAISSSFTDLYKARKYYLQALSILELARKTDTGNHLYFFRDHVLSYLLSHAPGEFSPEMMMTDGVRELRAEVSTVDYWDTLRQFLDNECNASETARKMFLHRSTLLTRLEHIREWLDLDDPDIRMYLRIMTRLLP